MNVDKIRTKVINSAHSIEFGESSWDSSVQSVRRRKNNAKGGFDPFSSSEIPLNGTLLNLGELVCVCLEQDQIPPNEMIIMFNALKDSFNRKGIVIP